MISHNPLHIHKLVLYCLVASCLSLGTIFIQTRATAQTNNKEVAPEVGDSAPDFSLRDFKGNKFTLSKLTKTKGVLLWFTNLCEGCQSQIPTVLRLKAEYEKKGVEVAAVSILGKDRKTVETVMKENRVSFRFLYDPDGTASKRYSGEYVEGTCPLKNIFVIEKGGNIVFANHFPGVQMNELKKLLDKLISETNN